MNERVVVVTGWRAMRFCEPVFQALDELKPEVVIHGGCHCERGAPRLGVDYWAHLWCDQNAATELIVRARWAEDGQRAAGPIRNQRMLVMAAQAWRIEDVLVLGFPHPNGSGTQDCLRRARALGFRTLERPIVVPQRPNITGGYRARS
jgi:hypothetical protein